MIQEFKEGYVKVEREHGIATIEFFHPQSNSLPGKILETLAHDIHSEGLNAVTKVIVLRSAGDKAFCAGASFDELAAITTKEEGVKFFSGFANVINAMRKCSKLIIARVHGKCVGGGVGIAAAADYAIAAEGAEIKLSELALGIGPFVVGPAVERKMGTSAFSQLAIDAGLWRPADWARRKGLFAELHAEISGMDDSITRLSTSLSHYNPEAMHELKKALWKGTEHWDELLHERAAISGRLILSQFSKDFIEKFKSKQKIA
ncbi:enoyl-CoA hydratase/isomerase family protein [Panacibacter ginsenosidivorans]|uniref:Enoyl-CoA hydratase/isomerase family protein n=1 Tax=Panacibacter ginsenosidivorans TaxID=1813871 RepID=A0A5B8V9H8_9BACT|nr:enoyl-CoA hydratase-related protein [Panacibacter ginsenosidivorans]QEC68127.1 enoyl-CoA hydratase/isomerase family protein [Panacibacter ginsenosidivorans]